MLEISSSLPLFCSTTSQWRHHCTLISRTVHWKDTSQDLSTFTSIALGIDRYGKLGSSVPQLEDCHASSGSEVDGLGKGQCKESKMAGHGGALISMLVVLASVNSAVAKNYIINPPGSNSGGWTFLFSNSTSYDDLFKNTTLFVGDSLSKLSFLFHRCLAILSLGFDWKC